MWSFVVSSEWSARPPLKSPCAAEPRPLPLFIHRRVEACPPGRVDRRSGHCSFLEAEFGREPEQVEEREDAVSGELRARRFSGTRERPTPRSGGTRPLLGRALRRRGPRARRVRDRRRRKRRQRARPVDRAGRYRCRSRDPGADRTRRAKRRMTYPCSLFEGTTPFRGKEHEPAHMVRYDPERCRPLPVSDAAPAFEMRASGNSRSIRNMSGASRAAIVRRSSPPPKFTLRCGRFSKPEAVRRYCMNTEFPISM